MKTRFQIIPAALRVHAICSALRFAAEGYDKFTQDAQAAINDYNAATPEQRADAERGLVHPRALTGIKEQFERQASEARAAADFFDGNDLPDDFDGEVEVGRQIVTE